MKTLTSHSRTDQIVINVDIDHFANDFFEIFQKKLKESYVFQNKRSGNIFRFKGSIFRFAWNGWNVFNPITHGFVEFYTRNGEPFILHRINFTEAFVIAMLFTIIPVFTIKFVPTYSLIFLIITWLFYGINYLVSVFRFNSYISNTLIEVNENSKYDFEETDEFIEDDEEDSFG